MFFLLSCFENALSVSIQMKNIFKGGVKLEGDSVNNVEVENND